jgi:hypothetical protein
LWRRHNDVSGLMVTTIPDAPRAPAALPAAGDFYLRRRATRLPQRSRPRHTGVRNRGGQAWLGCLGRGVLSMSKAEDLRRQAERALRLAQSVTDEQAAQALRVRAAELIAEAQNLEGQPRPNAHNELLALERAPLTRVDRTRGRDPFPPCDLLSAPSHPRGSSLPIANRRWATIARRA